MESKELNFSKITRNFLYFTANFQPGFIEKVWEEEPLLASHLKTKFKSKVNSQGFISSGGFINWFFDLSEDRQSQLIKWVTVNYKGL